MKKFLSILLAAMMVLAMTVPETGKPGDLPIKDYIAELNK